MFPSSVIPQGSGAGPSSETVSSASLGIIFAEAPVTAALAGSPRNCKMQSPSKGVFWLCSTTFSFISFLAQKCVISTGCPVKDQPVEI